MQIKSLMSRVARILAFTVALLGGQGAPAAEPVSPPPAEAFFNPPEMQSMVLSPSGRYAAFIGTRPGDRSQLIIVDTQSKAPPTSIAQAGHGTLRKVDWLSDDLLALSVLPTPGMWLRTMFTVERDGKNFRALDLDKGNVGLARSIQNATGSFAFTMAVGGVPSRLIVQEGTSVQDKVTNFRPWEWEAGKWRRILHDDPPHPQVYDWMIDNQGKARLAFARKGETRTWFYNTATDSQPGERWAEMGRWTDGELPFGDIKLLPGRRIGVTVPNAQTGFGEFREFDVETRRPKEKVIAGMEGFDISVTPISDDGSVLAGFRIRTDDWETAWQMPAMSSLQEKVDQMLPGRVNTLDCKGCRNAESVLVRSYSDRQPGEYLHYSSKTGEWQKLGGSRPALDENRLGRTQLLRVAARDGLELPVWVTAPAGVPLKTLRTVVRVHDGPWQRGRDWGFEAGTQFLASRGYLVVEPEFRGSKGFGDKLYRAGFKQWGQRMQDDLADALSAVVAKGWADPAQVCIAGEGYGGYATLMALARQGELFRCGVAWAAMTDLPSWLEKNLDEEKRALVGDIERDAEALAANSPRTLAKQIKAPVLLAHGAEDREVPAEQGKSMRDALAAAGRPPQWVLYDDEPHLRNKPANQIDFWQRVERFLGQNLKQ